LFKIVVEALSRNIREGLPYELLYADDLVIVADTFEMLKEKLSKWRTSMEDKGLRVNMGKTKVMRCREGEGQVKATGKYPCGVCMKGVGSNSIACTKCGKWVHKKCSGIKGKLVDGMNFLCAMCRGQVPGHSSDDVREMEISQGEVLECVKEFCYLGDMLGCGGGAVEASRARVRVAWRKYNLLKPMLARRGASWKVKGKIYRACVQSVLVYGSETWPIRREDEMRLERTENRMVRMMCGVKLQDRISSEDLRGRLGIEGVVEVIRRGRLRWFGHLERKDEADWVSKCREVKVVGKGVRGRPRKTWNECVNKDLKDLQLKPEWAKDREKWRGCIHGNVPTCAQHGKRTLRR
jgi:hypothetical protein